MAKNKNTKNTKKEDEGEILDDVLSDEEPQPVTETEAEEFIKEDSTTTAKTPEDDTEEVKLDDDEQAGQAETKPELPKKDAKQPIEEAQEEEAPPPRPTRPPTPRQQALKSLQEAFPTVEEKYIQSHLIASSYNLEQAFNALLYLSDPENFNLDEVLPQQEASKNIAAGLEHGHEQSTTAPGLPQRRLTQLEEDELLAKSLDEEYRRKAERRHSRRQNESRRQRVGKTGENADDDDDDNIISNFVEKDLPQIKEQFSKNLEETKNKFNNWVGGWKKQYSSAQEELNNRQIKKKMRDEFDDDPQEVDLQKFHGIKLSDDSEEVKPKMPARHRAQSTDLYGTPKHKESEAKKTTDAETETVPSATTAATKSKTKKSSTPADDDDDFLLSD